jgi:putative PIN family toxin of toxin-antitoxin system
VDRVVIDPAVLVSALISPLGNPAKLWLAVRDRRIGLVACPHLLAELATVLARERFRRYVTIDEAEAFVREVARAATTLPDPVEPPSVSRDPNDDYLVSLARTAAVRALVSGDHDLTELANLDPPVLTPASAVAELL